MSEQDEMSVIHTLTHAQTHSEPKADEAEQCPLKALATDHNIIHHTVIHRTMWTGISEKTSFSAH